MESNFRRGVWVQFRDLVVDPGGRRISKALKDSTFRGLYIILKRPLNICFIDVFR
jgi:hypothetical protein